LSGYLLECLRFAGTGTLSANFFSRPRPKARTSNRICSSYDAAKKLNAPPTLPIDSVEAVDVDALELSGGKDGVPGDVGRALLVQALHGLVLESEVLLPPEVLGVPELWVPRKVLVPSCQ